MKTKLTTLSILLLSGMVAATGCNNATTSTSTSDSTSTTAKVDTAMQNVKDKANAVVNDVKEEVNNNPDSNFLVRATMANMEEINVLQAGIDNGTSKDVKAHAKMMIADHKKLGAKVSAYAAKKGYTLPADDGGKGNDDLAKLNKHTKGTDWDKAWVDMMVDGHSDAISLFEKAEDKVKDADLKQLITDALPTLHNHYNMVKELQSNMAPNK